MIGYGYLILAILFNIIAQFLLKVGAKNINNIDTTKSILNKIIESLTNPYFLGALFTYGIAFLIYYLALSKIELSKAYPLVSISVLIAIFSLSVIFLNETLNFIKALGFVLCILGIILIFWKS